jgi:hypothetical protein
MHVGESTDFEVGQGMKVIGHIHASLSLSLSLYSTKYPMHRQIAGSQSPCGRLVEKNNLSYCAENRNTVTTFSSP